MRRAPSHRMSRRRRISPWSSFLLHLARHQHVDRCIPFRSARARPACDGLSMTEAVIEASTKTLPRILHCAYLAQPPRPTRAFCSERCDPLPVTVACITLVKTHAGNRESMHTCFFLQTIFGPSKRSSSSLCCILHFRCLLQRRDSEHSCTFTILLGKRNKID